MLFSLTFDDTLYNAELALPSRQGDQDEGANQTQDPGCIYDHTIRSQGKDAGRFAPTQYKH